MLIRPLGAYWGFAGANLIAWCGAALSIRWLGNHLWPDTPTGTIGALLVARVVKGALATAGDQSRAGILDSVRDAWSARPYPVLGLAATTALSLVIDVTDDEGMLFTARYYARQRALNDAALIRLFFATPALPMRVLGAIHWEALKLWRKGVALRDRPKPPQNPITFIKYDFASRRAAKRLFLLLSDRLLNINYSHQCKMEMKRFLKMRKSMISVCGPILLVFLVIKRKLVRNI